MANKSVYKDGPRVHVFLTRTIDDRINKHLAPGDTKTSFIRRAVDYYCDYLESNSPITKDELEKLIIKYADVLKEKNK